MANGLYDVVAEAETGSFNNPWIRTTYAPEGGSTAFGPVQITGTKARDYADRKLISKESQQFVNDVLGPMYDLFIKYGKEPELEGYDKAYDYGGGGYFPTEYRDEYERLANEMLSYDYQQAGGDVDKFIRSWRGVGDDERYNKIIKDAMELIQSK